MQRGTIESYIGHMQDELLHEMLFVSRSHALVQVAA